MQNNNFMNMKRNFTEKFVFIIYEYSYGINILKTIKSKLTAKSFPEVVI